MQVGQLLGESSGEAAPPDSLAPLAPLAPRKSLGSPAPGRPPAGLPGDRTGDRELGQWLAGVQHRVTGVLAAFVRDRCAEYVHGVPGADFVAGLLAEFVAGGKFVRSTFTYLGWLSGAEESDTALRAAASAELLHAFALLQDDVMDRSALRRGRPSVHTRLADWHRAQGLSGRPSASVNRLRSCSPICAWCGRNSCCATAVSARPRWAGAGPGTTCCAASWPSASSPTW